MFELLSVIGVMLVAVSLVERQWNEKSKSDRESAGRPVRQTPPAARIAEVPTAEAARLGPTQAVPRDGRFAFVSGFGVRPEQLRELHVYSAAGKVDEFPRRVEDLLRKLYDNGYAVGEEIMAVLHHDRPLKEGEAIYVAVARDERTDATRTVAFLDRRRAC